MPVSAGWTASRSRSPRFMPSMWSSGRLPGILKPLSCKARRGPRDGTWSIRRPSRSHTRDRPGIHGAERRHAGAGRTIPSHPQARGGRTKFGAIAVTGEHDVLPDGPGRAASGFWRCRDSCDACLPVDRASAGRCVRAAGAAPGLDTREHGVRRWRQAALHARLWPHRGTPGSSRATSGGAGVQCSRAGCASGGQVWKSGAAAVTRPICGRCRQESIREQAGLVVGIVGWRRPGTRGDGLASLPPAQERCGPASRLSRRACKKARRLVTGGLG